MTSPLLNCVRNGRAVKISSALLRQTSVLSSGYSCPLGRLDSSVYPSFAIGTQCRMKGHNKWSKIKRKKGIKDVARSAAFAKASRAIIASARACGGDLSNLQLQSALSHAKNIQLPKDRIQDALDKATTKQKEGVEFTTLRYDGMISFDSQKVAFIVVALSDNRNRTASNVRTIIGKAGGEVLPTSSHNYVFDYVGVVLLENISPDDEAEQDRFWDCALTAGATEIHSESTETVVICEASDLWKLVTGLQKEGFVVEEFDQRYVIADPANGVSLSLQGQEELESFLDKLDEDQDVAKVYHNVILPEEEEEKEEA